MITTSPPPVDVSDLVCRARAAQPVWTALPVVERLRPVRGFRHLLVEECHRLCTALGRDIDKPEEEAVAGDVLPTADACRFLERQAARLLRPRKVPRGQRPLWLWGQADTVHRRPRGVVGVIGTWNYPVFLNGVQIAQALTAGNAVVWKPSEVVPETAGVLADLFRQAGFPADVLQVLPATRELGSALVEADIDHLVFTGACATGGRIAARLGERLLSSTLELSGIDAQFVLDDADVQLAAGAAWFGFTANRGQTCIAVRRAFVHRSLYDAFCARLRDLAVLDGPVPLALPSQAEQAERLVREALAGGARLLVQRSPAAAEDRCWPAALVDARPAMSLCREAAFAPVLAVLPFDDIEEALKADRECPFGLGASIFTRETRRAEVLSARLRTGMVAVNDVIVPTAHPATPFGGRGQSGWGVTQGAEGLLEMTVPQVVSVKGGTFRPHYEMAAGKGGARQGPLLRGLLEATHARTLGRRLRGWWQVIRGARAMRKG
jgi:acyl-CoA reductase-like NAD-dependent aldehyde dehydrogenase